MKNKKIIAGILASVLTAVSLAAPQTISKSVPDSQKVFAEDYYSEELELGAVKYKKVASAYKREYEYVTITGCDKEAESLDIPGEIEELPVYGLEQSCFASCDKLKEVKLPDILRVIPNGSFHDCISIESIEIPKSVISMGTSVFDGCDNLKSIEVDEDNPMFSSHDGVLYDKNKFNMLHYPAGRKDTSYEMPDTVYTMKSFYSFSNSEILEELTLPSTLENIYMTSLECCKNLEKVTILNPTCSIYEHPSTISNGKTGENDYYFNGTICGYKNSTAERYARECGYKFEAIEGTPISPYSEVENDNDIGVSYVKIDEDNDGTYDYAEIYKFFSFDINCEIPAELEELPVRVIGFTAVQSRIYESVNIPNTVKELRENAFCQGRYTKTVSIPESVEFIGKKAFFLCNALQSITISNPKCVIYDDSSTIANGKKDECYFDGTIYGYAGSTAEAYAEKYGYKFEALEGEAPDVPDPVVTAPPVTTTVTETTTTEAVTTSESSVTAPEGTTTGTTVSVPVNTGDPEENVPKVGDISGNGKIDLYDAIEIAKYLVKARDFTDDEKLIADFNGDGKVNLYDAIAIAVYILNNK